MQFDVSSIWNLNVDNSSDDDPHFLDYLSGKSVVVVGPAKSIIGSRQRDYIDSFDIVVRLNRALPIPEGLHPDTGNRCDILYHCMDMSWNCGGPISIDVLNSYGVSWLATPFGKTESILRNLINKFEKENNGHFPFHRCDDRFYGSVENIMNCRPNTGFMAMLDILRHPVGKMYVTGFTFFEKGYNKYYRDGKSEEETMAEMNAASRHEIEPQRKFIKQVFDNDHRFIGDEHFINSINKEV